MNPTNFKPTAVLVALGAHAVASPALGRTVIAAVQVLTDAPGAQLHPGESATILVTVAWTPQSAQFAGLRGDTRATNDWGTALELSSPFFFYSFNNPGQPTGGSIVGTDIAVIPGYFTASPFPGTMNNTGMLFLQYEWTAPNFTTPTQVGFNFLPDPVAPNARFYPSFTSPAFVEAHTTYLGTSILVLPAPPSAALPLLLPLAPRRRR